MDDKLQKLIIEYSEKYPKEESLTNYLFSFGEDELLEIIKGAKGRRIIFNDLGVGTDDGAKFRYE